MPSKNLVFDPQNATSDEEIERCFELMRELRPQLDQQQFLQTIRHMETEGYKLAFINRKNAANQDTVVAVAGYRITTNLFMGKNLYIDDLVTASQHRSKGYGEKLVTWLRSKAIEENCHIFHLDSGTHRGLAHKFYFQQGLTITSYHFSESLKTP